MKLSILALIIMATPAFAQQAPRDGDVLYDQAGLTALLTNQEALFYSGGLAEYFPDGRYSYRYELGGERVLGQYEVRDDSHVCTFFRNGFDRCDLVVQSGERIVFVVENGERYPVKSMSLIAN